MKKPILLFTLLLWFISCAKPDEGQIAESNPPINDAALDAVINDVYSLMNDLYGTGTRSTSRAIQSITPVSTTATRGADSCPLAYIVNFENNAGFAVVSTNPMSDNIIAIGDTGNIDPTEFALAMAQIEEDEAQTATHTRGVVWEDIPDDPDDWTYGDEGQPATACIIGSFPPLPTYTPTFPTAPTGGVAPGTLLIAQYVRVTNNLNFNNPPVVGNDSGNPGGGYGKPNIADWGPWSAIGGVPPLIRTKWSQYSPFNNACPFKGAERAPTGCTALATAQIAAYHGKTASWDAKTIAKFGTVIDGKHTKPEQDEDAVAQFIYWVGRDLSTTYGADGSSAKTSQAATFFRQRVGCKKVGRHKWSFDRVKGRLDLAIPVYMHGFHSNGSGHAWIVDGYMRQIRKDQKRTDKVTPEYRNLAHINWGWSEGSHDGYYIEGVFDPSQRAIAIDVNVGDKGNDRDDISAYTKRLKILTWGAPN